jgi:basic amino acid/polyamine antiporter, APA family
VLLCLPNTGLGMPFVRAIGRWTMTALVINCIIGNAIFGLPSELTRLVGRASPLSMILAALAFAVVMVSLAEVASQFSEPGGPYLYVRTAFGRFAGVQIGWFHLLAASAAGAANASLFMIYLTGLLPWVGGAKRPILLLALIISIPTVANLIGVRSGAALSNLLTVAKLLPLALLIILGVARFGHHVEIISASEISRPGIGRWLSALFLLFFAYGGPENALVCG